MLIYKSFDTSVTEVSKRTIENDHVTSHIGAWKEIWIKGPDRAIQMLSGKSDAQGSFTKKQPRFCHTRNMERIGWWRFTLAGRPYKMSKFTLNKTLNRMAVV